VGVVILNADVRAICCGLDGMKFLFQPSLKSRKAPAEASFGLCDWEN
jgi:hypothetical protein